MTQNTSSTPFALLPGSLPRWLRWGLSPVTSLLEAPLGLSRLGEIHRAIEHVDDPFAYARAALRELGVGLDCPAGELRRIPQEGPVVVVANHPLGLVDGLLLMTLLGEVRTDVRVLANRWLGRVPQLRDAMLPIDLGESADARRGNAASMREALRWIRAGKVLVVLPAGEVAHRRRGSADVLESDWQPGVARLLQRCGAPVVPVHIRGANSRWFQRAGLVSPRLRTALLGREALRAGPIVPIRVGNPVPERTQARFGDAQELADYLRLRTEILSRRVGPVASAATGPAEPQFEPIGDPMPVSRLETEIEPLAPLSTSGELEVYLARAPEIPAVLCEIGRLREITFRAVGEGSGKGRDLDRYDGHYHHLFLWNRERREVAGAYRLAPTDAVLAEHGPDGLYSTSLFEFEPAFLEHVTPGLELGRAFLTESYQRSGVPLALLWRGIAAFVAAHPRYRRLFGLVSISRDYDALSRGLMLQHCEAERVASDLSRWVRPRHPVTEAASARAGTYCTSSMVADLSDVSRMVAEIENDQRGVPVLMREYKKLGGVFLGFNVDPAFQDVVDGLVVVDLARTPERRLAHFMGLDVARTFLSWHGEVACSSSGC